MLLSSSYLEAFQKRTVAAAVFVFVVVDDDDDVDYVQGVPIGNDHCTSRDKDE